MHQVPAITSKDWRVPFFFVSALHCCNILVETFTVLVTHRTTVLRKSRWERRKWIFTDILHPSFLYEDRSSSIRSLQLSALLFPRKPVTISRKACHALCSSPVMMLSNISSRRSERMSGPVKTPSRILALLSRGNFCRRYRNYVPLQSIAFKKFFMRPNLI
jgi:hypothetical protein